MNMLIVPKPIVNAKEVRQFGVRLGIPNYDTGSTNSLIEKERKLLFRASGGGQPAPRDLLAQRGDAGPAVPDPPAGIR